MTRKRVGGGLLEHFSTPCEHCRGRGVIVTTEPVVEPVTGGERDGNGDTAARRTRGRGRRDEHADRPRRLPDSITPAVTPDRGEATLDVGAPAPAELTRTAAEEPAGVEPATVESVRDDVEEIVVEQALAAERNRHTLSAGAAAPERAADEATAAPPQPAGNGAVEAVPQAAVHGAAAVDTARDGSPAGGNGAAADGGRLEPAGRTPRRRGRVTRTAGAPAVTTGDAPAVAVVTVPVSPPVEAPVAPPVAAPADTVPTDVVPTEAAPTEAVPSDTAPTEAALTDTAPTEAVPTEAAPADTAPTDTAPTEAAPPPARPRRPRRAASRPAGPPAGGAGGDPV
jgi:ribonuclease E